jgi:Ca2+-binding RTX toxin-like protein
VVDEAGDGITELAAGGIDTVLAGLTFTLADKPQLENLTLTGTGNFGATGNALANVLTGNEGDNALDGGAGADMLKSGGGSDTFTGGGGADRFVIDRVNSLVAAISDFEAGVDKLGLGQAAYGALFTNGVLKAGVFANGTAASTATQRLFYNAGTGGLWYDSDGSGAAAAVQVATLSNMPASLLASNFVLAAGS